MTRDELVRLVDELELAATGHIRESVQISKDLLLAAIDALLEDAALNLLQRDAAYQEQHELHAEIKELRKNSG